MRNDGSVCLFPSLWDRQAHKGARAGFPGRAAKGLERVISEVDHGDNRASGGAGEARRSEKGRERGQMHPGLTAVPAQQPMSRGVIELMVKDIPHLKVAET